MYWCTILFFSNNNNELSFISKPVHQHGIRAHLALVAISLSLTISRFFYQRSSSSSNDSSFLSPVTALSLFLKNSPWFLESWLHRATQIFQRFPQIRTTGVQMKAQYWFLFLRLWTTRITTLGLDRCTSLWFRRTNKGSLMVLFRNHLSLILSMFHGVDAIRWFCHGFGAQFLNLLPDQLSGSTLQLGFGRISELGFPKVISFEFLIFRKSFTNFVKGWIGKLSTTSFLQMFLCLFLWWFEWTFFSHQISNDAYVPFTWLW